MNTRLFLAVAGGVVMLAGSPGCTKVYTDEGRTTVTTTGPVTTAPTPVADTIEFRVVGLALSTFSPVVVRHTDAVNGSTVYSGTVPYVVSFRSLDSSVFLAIDATATGAASTSALQVSIYVNGRLFREGVASGYTLSASANGTYRR